MPKHIYSNFNGGLSDSDRNAPNNQYYSGRDVDLYRNYGYLTPGYLRTEITMADMTSTPFEIIYDVTGQYAYLFGTARIWGVNTSTNAQLMDMGGGANPTYVSLAGLSQCKGLLSYITEYASTRALFAYNATHNDIGMAKIGVANWYTAGNYTAEWRHGFTSTYLNAGNRDLIDWQSYVWYTNGQYIGRFDPAVNPVAAGSFNDSFIDLGATWTSDLFFTTDNYLGIIGHKTDTTQNYSRIYLTNLAGDILKIINLEGISITSVKSKDGMVMLFLNDGSQNTIATLQNDGVDSIKILQHEISTTLTSLSCPDKNAIANYKNGLLFGTKGFLMHYGRRTINDNFALSCPMSGLVHASSTIGAIKQLGTTSDKFYVTTFDGATGDKKLYRFESSYSANSVFKGAYIDMGQKIKINYVKFYFKPLVASDSITCGLDIDYGTAVTLGKGTGNVSYSSDGAVTSKKFMCGKHCHAFRPTITWGAGGVAISKIVVDYQFVAD